MSAVKNDTAELAYNYVIVSTEIDLKQHAKELNQQLNGRGGGSSTAIQGTYFASEDSIKEVLLRTFA